MNNFFVLTTPYRNGVKDNYQICVNSSVKKKMHLGKFAVVTYYQPNLYKELKAPCIVVIDENLGDNLIRVDQTLRTAIGIDYGFDTNKTTVKIFPLCLTWIQLLKNFITSILGKRYIFFRVNKADIPDMEKNLCKIPPETFHLLGCDIGDSIVIENMELHGSSYSLEVYKIKAYEASENLIENRVIKEKKTEDKGFSARYPSATKLLNLSEDIPRIFLDMDARKTLKVDAMESLRVSRDISNLFQKQIREFGIIFFLSILAGAKVFPIELSQLIVISILIALSLVLINIRSRIK